MPVWGVWHDASVWFSSSKRSRKARNLFADPRCAVTTDNALEPVVLEGVAEVVDDRDLLSVFIERVNAKYETDYTVDFFDPEVNACFRVEPRWVFSLTEDDFGGSPTRWVFGEAARRPP